MTEGFSLLLMDLCELQVIVWVSSRIQHVYVELMKDHFTDYDLQGTLF